MISFLSLVGLVLFTMAIMLVTGFIFTHTLDFIERKLGSWATIVICVLGAAIVATLLVYPYVY